ncbi:hypothetical protein HYX17_00315 [Candidatus Woesearchaeota archaeon]|nr:hypothetical protein [Candidatus Woesearchaeota archaeon]
MTIIKSLVEHLGGVPHLSIETKEEGLHYIVKANEEFDGNIIGEFYHRDGKIHFTFHPYITSSVEKMLSMGELKRRIYKILNEHGLNHRDPLEELAKRHDFKYLLEIGALMVLESLDEQSNAPPLLDRENLETLAQYHVRYRVRK